MDYVFGYVLDLICVLITGEKVLKIMNISFFLVKKYSPVKGKQHKAYPRDYSIRFNCFKKEINYKM